jgi:hypothetical protein
MKLLPLGATPPGLLVSGTMRLFASHPAIFAAGAVAWGCAVYDTDLLHDGLAGGGSATSNAGNASSGGGSASSGGAKAEAGAGAISTAGEPAIEPSGDAGAGEGGSSGEPPAHGGSGGQSTAGAGGKPSSGGSAGATGSAGTAGAAGSGGSGNAAACALHAVPAKAKWVATASISSVGNGTEADPLYNPPSHVADGSPIERWSTGKPQDGSEWLQIDFGALTTVTKVTLQLGGNGANMNDYPRSYAIKLSNTSLDVVSTAQAIGNGMLNTDVVATFAPATGRYLLVQQTGSGDKWWTVAEVLVDCN